jgi:hypothetical protein
VEIFGRFFVDGAATLRVIVRFVCALRSWICLLGFYKYYFGGYLLYLGLALGYYPNVFLLIRDISCARQLSSSTQGSRLLLVFETDSDHPLLAAGVESKCASR